MKISVVIPTYNRLEQLKRVLSGLKNQTFEHEKFEVLVISDGSSDGTDDYLRAVKTSFSLRPFFQANQGPAAARNMGISQSSGEIILFIDDDVFPVSRLIEEHQRSHDQYGDRAVVIGPMLAPPDCRQSPWVRWEADHLAEQYRDMSTGKWAPTARQFYTGNSSIARHHLAENKGFDPSFHRAEDIELAYRLDRRGLKFFFNPRAAGYHYAKRSLDSWLATPYAYGRNDIIFFGAKGHAWILPQIHKEFYFRHPLIRTLILACLPRPGLSKSVLNLLRNMTRLSEKVRLDSISSFACSGMFNLRYYEGVADQLGDRQAFTRNL